MAIILSPFPYYFLPILPFDFAASPIMWKSVLPPTKLGVALGLALDNGMRQKQHSNTSNVWVFLLLLYFCQTMRISLSQPVGVGLPCCPSRRQMRESSRGQQSNLQTTHSGPEGQREPRQGKLTMVPITTQPLINAQCLKSLSLGIFSAQFILSHYMTNACDAHWEKSE